MPAHPDKTFRVLGPHELDEEHRFWSNETTRSNWNDEYVPVPIDTDEDEEPERMQVCTDDFEEHIRTHWKRTLLKDDPEYFAIDSARQDMVIQMNDVDYVMVENPCTSETYRTVLPDAKGTYLPYETVPMIRIFGIGENGEDVLAYIHNFLPYFYVDSGILEHIRGTDTYVSECERITDVVSSELNALLHRWLSPRDRLESGKYVHESVVVERTSAYGYNDGNIPVLKITLKNPRHVSQAREHIGAGHFRTKASLGYCYHTFDSAIDFVTRFNSQKKTAGHAWFRLSAGNYSVRSSMHRPDLLCTSTLEPIIHPVDSPSDNTLECALRTNGLPRTSYCNIELDATHHVIEPLDHREPPYDKHGNYKLLSYDIEVGTPETSKTFPHPSNPEDRIISIAAHVVAFGQTDNSHPVKHTVVFGLDDATEMLPLDTEEIKKERVKRNDPSYLPKFPEPPPRYYPFMRDASTADQAERALILSFARFIRNIRPDIVTGWNIDRFDGWFLFERSKYLNIAKRLNFGRVIQDRCRLKKLVFQSNAFGKTEYDILTMTGVVDFDGYPASKKDVTLSLKRYNLNTVAEHVLRETKLDMPYEEITPTYNSGPEGRAKVHRYCVQDARLVWKIIDSKGWHFSNITQARYCGVPLKYLSFRGVQIRILAYQLRVLFTLGWLIPYIRDDVNRVFRRTAKYTTDVFEKKHGFTWDNRDERTVKKRKSSAKRSKGYSGATVIEPKKGWHQYMVAIMDFASLYPNMMRRSNLCFSTILLDPKAHKNLVQGKDYRITASGCAFVLPHVRKGIIPTILDELLSLRAKAKGLLKRAKWGTQEWAMYNGRQNGLKVVANSMYGALGTLLGQLVNLDVAETVTTSGREALFQTCEVLEEISRRRKEFGYEMCYKTIVDPDTGEEKQVRDIDEDTGEWKPKLDAEGNPIWKIPCPLDVIYGDTDSVFVEFIGIRNKTEAFRIGQNVEDILNCFFEKPMAMEFENLLDGILLLMKKRYCGYATESLAKDFELYVKGLEIKRRDNAEFVKKLWKETLEIMLKERKPREALDHVHAFLRNLMAGEMPRESFVITQALTRNIEEYASFGPHVAVANKMRTRDPNNAPQCGDRVEYIICKGGKDDKVADRAEDPTYAQEHDMEIDYRYYAEKQVVEPFMRLFRPMWEFDMIQRNSLIADMEIDEYTSAFDVMMNSKKRVFMENDKDARSALFGAVMESHETYEAEAQRTLRNASKRQGPLDNMFEMVRQTPRRPITDRIELTFTPQTRTITRNLRGGKHKRKRTKVKEKPPPSMPKKKKKMLLEWLKKAPPGGPVVVKTETKDEDYDQDYFDKIFN